MSFFMASRSVPPPPVRASLNRRAIELSSQKYASCGVVRFRASCYAIYGVSKPLQSSAQSLLAGNVRRLREKMEWTQEQAADAIGIASRHFQKIEAGDVNVTVATLVRVAKAFKVPVKALFEEGEA